MKIFEIDYLDIPIEEYKRVGEIIVCLDPQKRLGEKTWAVLSSNGCHTAGDALGLFWEQEHALLFAGTVDTLDSLPIFTHNTKNLRDEYESETNMSWNFGNNVAYTKWLEDKVLKT